MNGNEYDVNSDSSSGKDTLLSDPESWRRDSSGFNGTPVENKDCCDIEAYFNVFGFFSGQRSSGPNSSSSSSSGFPASTTAAAATPTVPVVASNHDYYRGHTQRVNGNTERHFKDNDHKMYSVNHSPFRPAPSSSMMDPKTTTTPAPEASPLSTSNGNRVAYYNGYNASNGSSNSSSSNDRGGLYHSSARSAEEQLDETRRRVEAELAAKMERATAIEERRSRSRSPLLSTISGLLGLSQGRDVDPDTLSTATDDAGMGSHTGSAVSELAHSVASDGSGTAAAADGAMSELSSQEVFERLLDSERGLPVTVYLTSRDGETKSKRALMRREQGSSAVYVEIRPSKPRRQLGQGEPQAKRLRFDLAADVMMVARGRGQGRGPHDARVPASVDDGRLLHFALKSKPELNVEVDGEELPALGQGSRVRDAVLTGFMQLISRHRNNAHNGKRKHGHGDDGV